MGGRTPKKPKKCPKMPKSKKSSILAYFDTGNRFFDPKLPLGPVGLGFGGAKLIFGVLEGRLTPPQTPPKKQGVGPLGGDCAKTK